MNGNIIAEADDNGAILREYIWIAPVGGEIAQSGTATPLAFVDTPKTAPKFTYVFPDHLDRPVYGTDDSGAYRWQVAFKPFGEVLRVYGPEIAVNDNVTSTRPPLDARFPGQMYQLESGLAYNWHRHYDASIGRYIQPDPLGLIDGPSRYAYAGSSPQMYVDPRGLEVNICCRPAGIAFGMLNHCWVTTDTKSAGMGANPNIAPGEEYEGIGTPVMINDHSNDKPTQCTVQNNVNEQCVNNRLQIGKPIGRFLPPYNHCQSFAYGIVNSCRTGPQMSIRR